MKRIYFVLTTAFVISFISSSSAQTERCFAAYMMAFTERGMEVVPDGEQKVVIGVEEADGKQTCLMGKIMVKEMNVVPPLYILRETGVYETASGYMDIDWYKREAEGPIPTQIAKAMTPTYYLKEGNRVRLFFLDYLKPDPGKRVTAPSLTKEESDKMSNAAKEIRFQSGKEVLLAESFSSLNSIAAAMKEHPETTWKIEGYTDNTGKPASNLALSQRRADAVKSYLVAQGVDGSKLTATGFGDQNPIADNKTAEGRTANRRVEIKPAQ